LEQKIKYEQKLIADLKEYSDRPETTVLDGITSVLAEILVRLDALDERAVRTENSLDLLWQRYQLLAKYTNFSTTTRSRCPRREEEAT
jgi:hypothetical protein